MKAYTFTLLTIAASLGVTSLASAESSKDKGPKKHKLTFAQADADSSGGLTVFEFAKTQGKGTPLVEIRRRFLPIDTAGAFEVVLDPVTGEPAVDPVSGEPIVGDAIPDGVISLEEWNAYKALDEKEKSHLSRFQLADFDGDGLLSPVEFTYLFSPQAKAGKKMKKFNKADTDDDGFLSPTEFKKDKQKVDDDA